MNDETPKQIATQHNLHVQDLLSFNVHISGLKANSKLHLNTPLYLTEEEEEEEEILDVEHTKYLSGDKMGKCRKDCSQCKQDKIKKKKRINNWSRKSKSHKNSIPRYTNMLHLILLTQLVELVTSHASMIMPPSRNAIDSNLPAWHNSNISNPPETGTIEPYNCRCTNGTEPFCNAGQACFWFSQGCTIGCSKCDGLGARSVYFF